MTTLEERISRLEGGYDHLATKADVSDLKAAVFDMKADMMAEIAHVEARTIRWTVGLVLGGMTAISALTIIISKFLA